MFVSKYWKGHACVVSRPPIVTHSEALNLTLMKTVHSNLFYATKLLDTNEVNVFDQYIDWTRRKFSDAEFCLAYFSILLCHHQE